MNKLLVTGMVLGRDAGVCGACNYDLDWLIHFPSILLWTDRLLMTETLWKVVQEEALPNPPELAKSCKLIFEIARERGILEIVKPAAFVGENLTRGYLVAG